MKEFINSTFSVIVTTLVYLLGGFDIALKSLIIFMVIDYITGMISAIINKKLSSKTGVWGIFKKILMLSLVAVAVVVDNLTGESGVFRTIVIYFYVGNEGISILENLVECDVKIPAKIKDILEQIKEK